MRLLTFIWLLVVPTGMFAQNFPEKTNQLVNDYTNTLSSSEVQKLEKKLVQYDNETSVQIAIVIIKSLGGYEISDYAFELGEKWGIGSSESDNGALVLVSMEDRKMWIATGYGLESTVTDALSKRIIENEMKPRFRNGDFAGGLEAASDAIILASKGEYAGKGNGGGGGNKKAPIPFIIILILTFGFIWLIKAIQVRKYARINGVSFWAAWMLLNAASRSHSGSWSSFSGGSGGFGGGGGFGGFGGGSFGGGGAGGSW